MWSLFSFFIVFWPGGCLRRSCGLFGQGDAQTKEGRCSSDPARSFVCGWLRLVDGGDVIPERQCGKAFLARRGECADPGGGCFGSARPGCVAVPADCPAGARGRVMPTRTIACGSRSAGVRGCRGPLRDRRTCRDGGEAGRGAGLRPAPVAHPARPGPQRRPSARLPRRTPTSPLILPAKPGLFPQGKSRGGPPCKTHPSWACRECRP